jgi:cytochrome c oxidase subunit II
MDFRSKPVKRLLGMLGATALGAAAAPVSGTSIFAPASTPAHSIFRLSLFVLSVTGLIFAVVFTLLLTSCWAWRCCS